MTEVKRIFKVKGKPFFPIGGQASSAGAYNDAESEPTFQAVKLLHGNTLLTDVYWEQIEPTEGKFDFTAIDHLIDKARSHGIKLILLWFATWKNANMDYAPAWIKTNPQRFQRVLTSSGKDKWVLSSHCPANLDADKKAFTALCKFLKTKDGVENTVVGIQVENEPGIVGSDRDYGPQAQAEFDRPVPAKLLAAMKVKGNGTVYEIWQQAGGKKTGTWPQIFGAAAGELFTAWSIGSYIDAVAAAGKAAYDIGMYMNVAMMDHPVWSIPGANYPSGGAVSKVLDLYKWITPHLDLIAPDIKPLDAKTYEEMCAFYTRDDNPLFMPETPATSSLFRAVADYNLTGFHRMGGLEAIMDENGAVRPEAQVGVDSIRIVASVTPLLLKYQGTGKIHAVVQEEFAQKQYLENLEGYVGMVQFGSGGGKSIRVRKDWRHAPIDMYSEMITILATEQSNLNRGRGLVIQTGSHEFYMVGANFQLFLSPKPRAGEMQTKQAYNEWGSGRHVSVEEGHFNGNGKFIVDRRRNGDVLSAGLWVEPDINVLHVITCD